jgi:hypothetical protein
MEEITNVKLWSHDLEEKDELKYLRIQYIKHHATKAYEGTEVCLHAF